VRIPPADTTPLSDENAPDPTRPSPQRKKAQAPKPHGAVRVDATRRSLKDTDPGSEKKPPRQTKAEAKTVPALESPLDRSAPRVPEAGVKTAPKPEWAPDRPTEGPPRIPNWESAFASTSRPDARWQRGDETTVPDAPVHVAPLTRRRRRSRVFVVAVVLLCLLFAFVAVAAIRSSHHNPTAATLGPRAPSTSEVSSSEVARVELATYAADRATITTRSNLKAISGIPTLTNVAAIILPYVTSLQRYETALAGTVVPAAAQSTVGGVRSLVRQDLQFLGTLDGLPSVGLGTYLAEVGRRSTQLQMAFSEVVGDLRAATS
jgi:hypothetical protein